MNRINNSWLLIAGLTLVIAGMVGGSLTGPGEWGGMGAWHHTMMGGWGTSATAQPIQGAAEAEVVVGEFTFSPSEISVTAGQPVNLILVNEGSVPHNLVVAELDLRLEAGPGQSSTAGFTPTDPGRYSVECTYPGHAGAGMRATMIVVES